MNAPANLAFDLDESFAAIVFDCDGTLVDTAPVHFLAVNEAMHPFGLQMDAPWYYQRVGLTPQALFSDYEQANNLTLDVPAITARYVPSFLANLHQMQEIKVVADVARYYHGRIPMAVGSNGRLDNVTATLKATGLFDLFDTIVSAEQVAHGKPAPDVYLEAARRLNVAPERCIVFEDTDEGLEAAHRAGMRGLDIRKAYQPEWVASLK
jgi:beta-phosphoglucomutase-like phosphatase (HAD superfamily)